MKQLSPFLQYNHKEKPHILMVNLNLNILLSHHINSLIHSPMLIKTALNFVWKSRAVAELLNTQTFSCEQLPCNHGYKGRAIRSDSNIAFTLYQSNFLGLNLAPQHFLYFRPLPHSQIELRLIASTLTGSTRLSYLH